MQVPRNGFSRQAAEILKEIQVAFDTFDILENEEVRRALKTFSKWKTYPQLYVEGKLIGGLDILKGLHEEGKLAAIVAGTAATPECSIASKVQCPCHPLTQHLCPFTHSHTYTHSQASLAQDFKGLPLARTEGDESTPVVWQFAIGTHILLFCCVEH